MSVCVACGGPDCGFRYFGKTLCAVCAGKLPGGQMSGGLGSGLPSPYSQMLGAANQSTLSQHAVANQQWAMQMHMQALQLRNSAVAAPKLKPDPKQPDTLGWREWRWSDADGCLRSPSQSTLWRDAELVVPDWDEGDVVRGVSGIHAHLVPKHWKILGEQGEYVPTGDPARVHGIVERFGKYVLGTEGWRAEWVVIKELMAPSTEVGLKIEKAYPDVIVHYPEEEGDLSCTSETSSKLEKGSRSTSRPRPNPPQPTALRAVIQSGALSPISPPAPILPLSVNSSPSSQQSDTLPPDALGIIGASLFLVSLFALTLAPLL